MTAACLDVIMDALQEVRAYAAGEDPSADDAAFCMTRLQAIINDKLGTTTVYATTDPFPHADTNAFMYELALDIAESFGSPLGPTFGRKWQTAHNRLAASLAIPVITPADDAVQFLSRQVGRWGWLGF